MQSAVAARMTSLKFQRKGVRPATVNKHHSLAWAKEVYRLLEDTKYDLEVCTLHEDQDKAYLRVGTFYYHAERTDGTPDLEQVLSVLRGTVK